MNLSEGQLSLVADCVHNLKWHNDDLRKAAVLARQGPQGDQRTPKVTQPNQSTQQQQQQQYPQPTKTQQDSINDLRNSIDVGKLVINRAPRTLDASSALAPQRSYPPSVAGSDVLDINAERSVFANVMNPAASKIWEKCVKVYLIGRNQEKLTTMIDISNATDGSAVRSIILGYEKFHLSPRIYPKIALYSAKDAAGSYDSTFK
ncbi:hypothetical protein BDR26DRAFT_20261 [Obelidium mucronatum]|nr:hypothetical protein BDR26DRAFT_20261 [Obelidium mucronatum]